MVTEPERVILTYEDLIALPNDRNRYEIFEGELQVTASPNISHQTAVTNLTAILVAQVRVRRLGWVFTAPCDVLLSDITVVEPDLLFVSRGRRRIIVPRHIRGAPDLVVEVLSPSTAETDRQVKSQLYARYQVANYWRLDPDRWELVAEALDDGVYRQVAVGRESQTVVAPPFPELEIPLAQVWGWDQE